MISPSPPLGELAPTPLGVEPCSCDEALALREQLATLRAHHDTDAETCREALDRVDELTAELERCNRTIARLTTERDAERAETERLRAKRTVGAVLDAEAKLAAANALLDEAAERDRDLCSEIDAANTEIARLRDALQFARETVRAQNIAYDRVESKLAAANALLELMLESGLQPSLDARIRAHLAGQAPASAEAEHAAGYRFEREFPALEHIIARGSEPRLRALESAWGEGGGDGRD